MMCVGGGMSSVRRGRATADMALTGRVRYLVRRPNMKGNLMPRKPVVDPVGMFLLGFGTGGTVIYLLDPLTIIARGFLTCCVVVGAASLILRLVRRDTAG